MSNRKTKPPAKSYRKLSNDQICNICRQKKQLTEDHVPPKGSVSTKAVVIKQFFQHMIGENEASVIISQNGVKFKTICARCNNSLINFDKQLKYFCQRVSKAISSKLILPNPYPIECRPNAIMKSVLGHLLAAKTQTDDVVIDAAIRPCLQDFSIPIPDNIHIFYWIYPYTNTRILRDFVMPAKRGNFKSYGFFNMIKFYPIAFLISDNLSVYEGLPNLDTYRNLLPEQKAEVLLPLDFIPNEDWPERVDETNIIAGGRAMNDGIIAQPKTNKL